MDYSSGTPMSSTISSPSPPKTPTLARRQLTSGTRAAQCTHTTMTRLYTDEFRCSFCLKPGSMGWLWRCTQDRELLIEDDWDHSHHEHLDIFSANFPHPEVPRKLSPAARTNGFAFLDEVTENQFKEYTTEQVAKILEQRAKVLRTARADSNPLTNSGGMEPDAPMHETNQSLSARYSMPAAADTSKKQWLPNLECQFKCCQRCRSSCRDRSYISLNAVANGEYLPSAVAGFGFHLQGKRPVSSAAILRTIGLRPSPKPKASVSSPSKQQTPIDANSHRPTQSTQSIAPISGKSSPFNDEQNADTTFSQPPSANFYDSTAMTRSLNAEASRFSYNGSSTPEVMQTLKSMLLGKRRESEDSKKDIKVSRRDLPCPPVSKADSLLLRNATTDTPTIGKEESVKSGVKRSQSANRRSVEEERGRRKLSSLDTHAEASDTSPQRTDSEPSTPSDKKRPSRHRYRVSPTPCHRRTSSKRSVQEADSDEEDYVISPPRPLSVMEEREKREGSFSGEPLTVQDGVAVTEEAVSLHVPDVITQF